MRLVLKNFKCWENAEFVISENGITLLSGNSGCGKTSILQGIYFALYDKGTKLVRIGASSCRVELEGFGMHIVRTKKPNRLVVDGKYEDEAGQAMIDRTFGRNFNVVSYIEQDSFKSLVYMTPAARLEFMENFAFENVDIERVKDNLKKLVRDSEDLRMKAQVELEFHTRNLLSRKRPETVLQPDVERPLHEIVKRNSEEMDVLVKKKADLQHELAKVRKRATEALATREAAKRINGEISELEARIENTKYCGDIEYNRLCDLLKKSVNAREYIGAKNKYDELLLKYKTLRGEEERLYREKIDQLSRELWTGLSKQETLDALSDARNQTAINKEYTALSARIDSLKHIVEEYNNLLPVSGVLTTCPGCACSVSIVEGTTLMLSAERDESAVLRVQALRPQYREYIQAQSRLSSLEYRDVDLASLETYFSENINREKQLAALSAFSPSAALASIFREGKEIKQKLDQTTDADIESAGTDESCLRETLAEQKSRKDVVEMLLSQISAKKTQCPSVTCEKYDGIIADLEAQISDTETRLSELCEISARQVGIEKAWHEYDSFVCQEKEYTEILSSVTEAQELLKRREVHCKNVQRLKELVSISESECLVNIVNTINIHAQQFIDAFFQVNPLSAQLVTFKEVKSGRSTVSKPQIDLRIEYKGQETELSSLSGGERARLSLAFTLALAEIYNHPLLMLDESISSLDYESTVDVVQAIKEILVDKTVLIVSHQANTGIFDHVVNF